MILFVIGSDRNLFKKNSDIWNRYLDYGKLFDEIHITVFSSRCLGNKEAVIGNNVFVHPTNHILKCFYWLSVLRIFRRLKSKRLKTRRDIVISSQDPFEAGIAGLMAKKILKAPLQVQTHTDFLSSYFACESLINKIRVALAKFVIPRADGVRVVSERIKKSIVGYGLRISGEISVLPIFVDVGSIKRAPVKEDLHKRYPDFDFIILMASRLSREKNIGMAIEAVAEIIKSRPRLGLVICGRGPELQNLIAKSEGLKIKNNVVFEGWSGDLASYYKTADLYLLTSDYEGYGRSVLEAMAAGLPVVMTDVGLAGELLVGEKGGLVSPAGDEKALADNIKKLLADPAMRRKIGAEGQKSVENLMTKEQYLMLYKKGVESLLL